MKSNPSQVQPRVRLRKLLKEQSILDKTIRSLQKEYKIIEDTIKELLKHEPKCTSCNKRKLEEKMHIATLDDEVAFDSISSEAWSYKRRILLWLLVIKLVKDIVYNIYLH